MSELYEVRWYGRERILMSRNYCRSRESVQKYIDGVLGRISMYGPCGCRIFGRSPDYFVTFDVDRSGIDIRKVNEAKSPYNMLEDTFDKLHFLFSCKFTSMLNEKELQEFARQEKERQANDS